MEKKATVKKSTLDSAIKAELDLQEAHATACSNGKRLKNKYHKQFCDIVRGYCDELEDQARKQNCIFYNFWDIVAICVYMSNTPYETAYKMLALLNIEVAE